MSYQTGDTVIAWELGKRIEFSGICGAAINEGLEVYRKVGNKGPYHIGYIFKDTYRNRKLIDVFNKQYTELENAKEILRAIVMLAFRDEE